MAGTEGADVPFWSADSRSIGFFAPGKLKRIDIAGGPPQVLANTSGPAVVHGTRMARSCLGGTGNGPLSRIAASGGEPGCRDPARSTAAVGPSEPAVSTRWPPFSFLRCRNSGGFGHLSGIARWRGTETVDGGRHRRRVSRSGRGRQAEGRSGQGMIAFVRGTTLLAQHLDLKRGELTGDPVRLADPVGSNGIDLAVFQCRRMAEWPTVAAEEHCGQLKWYDRTGKPVGVAGEPDSSLICSIRSCHQTADMWPSLRTVRGNMDVWLLDLVRGGMTRFTVDPAIDVALRFGRTGMRIVFTVEQERAPTICM